MYEEYEKSVVREVKTVPLCPAAALRRLDIGVVIVGDGQGWANSAINL